ncbi:hypothetical protein [Longispora albida]|uniref:hypothetical protein n=1 Tax=Longispora albida TaxID=203523 RepID=UPI0003A6F518|nr:hypothetical protein [Longispora albida]
MSIPEELKRLGQQHPPVTPEETASSFGELLRSFDALAADPAQLSELEDSAMTVLARRSFFELGARQLAAGHIAEARQWLHEAAFLGCTAAPLLLDQPFPPPEPCGGMTVPGSDPGHGCQQAATGPEPDPRTDPPAPAPDPGPETVPGADQRAARAARAMLDAAREEAIAIVAQARQDARELADAAAREAAEVIVNAYSTAERRHYLPLRSQYPPAAAGDAASQQAAADGEVQLVLLKAEMVEPPDVSRSCRELIRPSQVHEVAAIAVLCIGFTQALPQAPARPAGEPAGPARIRSLMDQAAGASRTSPPAAYSILQELLQIAGPAAHQRDTT